MNSLLLRYAVSIITWIALGLFVRDVLEVTSYPLILFSGYIIGVSIMGLCHLIDKKENK